MSTRFYVRPAYGKAGFEVVDTKDHRPIVNDRGNPKRFKTRADALRYARAANAADDFPKK